MTNKVVITAGDNDVWGKLAAIQKIDPAISGGIESVVKGHLPQVSGAPIVRLVRSGYEEIHEVDPGFCVHITDAVIDQDWRLTASSVDYTLRLRIAFSGEAGYVARGDQVFDESARCFFIIRPPGEALTANFRGGTPYRYCSLSITRDYLRNTLGLADDDLPAVLENYWPRSETVMGHFPMSKASLAQASRLFNIRLPPAWHDLMVRTLSLELLRMLFEDWQSAQSRSRTAIRLSSADRSKLVRIREQIAADPAAPMTLARLCAKVKMNRNKLHFGFKQQFGVTVHEYQTELRMQGALVLLRTTDLPIAEIAERSGYGEPTNFTAAFKKHFGSRPRDARTGGGDPGQRR
jgi:AraC-like DNA-binding protein